MDRYVFTAVVVRSSWLPPLTGEAQEVPLISRLSVRPGVVLSARR